MRVNYLNKVENILEEGEIVHYLQLLCFKSRQLQTHVFQSNLHVEEELIPITLYYKI